MQYENFKHEVMQMVSVNEDQAERIIAAVLQELHDRLSPKEANDLAAQLPGELKRMWHGFDVAGQEVRRRHKPDFVRHVAEAAELPEDIANRAVMAVFKGVQMLLHSRTGQEGEAWDIFSQLPKDLKRVWTAAAGIHAEPERRAAKNVTINCPHCHSGEVQISLRSAPLGGPHPTWRHYHGRCRSCDSELWWAGPPSLAHPKPQMGPHDCPFFAPASP
jgi:uncharacterized protein (DUF2267 family)